MAQQTGEIKITGTIGDICFYKMEGEHYARAKSSLTRKRFYTDPVFEGSRASSTALGRASKLASKLYHQLPREKKGRQVFSKLSGAIKLLIISGGSEPGIRSWFAKEYLEDHKEQKQKVDSKQILVPDIKPYFRYGLPCLFNYLPLIKPGRKRKLRYTLRE